MWDALAGRLAISQQPDAITLSRAPEAAWRDPAWAGRLAAPLREKGFVDLGLFDVRPRHGHRLGILLNEREQVAAFLHELPTGAVTLELSVRYLDGTTTALVNYAPNGVPRPPFFRVIFAGPDASSGELYERLLRERLPDGIKAVTADTVAAEYEAAYARMMAFMKTMGLSGPEVAAIAARARQPATYIPSAKPPAPPAAPAADPGVTDVPCPHCGQLNERQREVCWACCGLMSGQDRPHAPSPSSPEQPGGPVPFPLLERLRPGERVLWHGRPRSRLDLRGIPLLALPATWVAASLLMWLGRICFRGFAYPWTLDSVMAHLGDGALVFGFVFTAAAVLIVLGPFLQSLLRLGVYYAVTDRRVLVVRAWPLSGVIARDLETVTVASVVNETWEGAGDVRLRFSVWTSAASDFEYVDNARDVAALIHMARQEAAARPLPAGSPGDAPALLARLVVPLHVLAIALCLLNGLSDLAAIIGSGGRVLAAWTNEHDKISFPPALFLLAAPALMSFLYNRLTRFQAGTRAARTGDVWLLAAFVALCGAILFWGGALSCPRTAACLIAGVFLLPGASGRELGRG